MHKHNRLYYTLLAATVSLSLAACSITHNDTAVIGGVRPNATPPVISKSVATGQTLTVDQLTAVNGDCSPAPYGVMQIKQQPMHGTVTVTQQDVYPTYPTTNPRNVCNKNKVPGLVATYTPTPGFTGSDLLTEEVITHEGMDTGEVKVVITVK